MAQDAPSFELFQKVNRSVALDTKAGLNQHPSIGHALETGGARLRWPIALGAFVSNPLEAITRVRAALGESAMQSESGDEGSGYKKPPKHSQFKKGQSGNPKGRPKGSKDPRTLLRDLMEEKVPVKIGGRSRWLSVMEVMGRTARSRWSDSPNHLLKYLQVVRTYKELMEKPQRSPLVESSSTVRFSLKLEDDDPRYAEGGEFYDDDDPS